MRALSSNIVGLAAAAALIGIVGAGGAEAQLYISGNIGASFERDAETTITASGGGGTATGDVELQTEVAVAGAVGYAFGAIRVEGELSYRNNSGEHFSGTGSVTAGGQTFAPGALDATDVTVLAVMANVWYDIPTGTPWKPYIGGGIGLARVSLDMGHQDLGFGGLDESDTVFAYQLGVGIGYAMTPQVTVGLSYRYFGTQDPKWEATLSGAAITAESEVSVHNVFAGVMVSF